LPGGHDADMVACMNRGAAVVPLIVSTVVLTRPVSHVLRTP
jgi:uncharacterized membrane protein